MSDNPFKGYVQVGTILFCKFRFIKSRTSGDPCVTTGLKSYPGILKLTWILEEKSEVTVICNLSSIPDKRMKISEVLLYITSLHLLTLCHKKSKALGNL